jgi:hypothetical protein
MPSLLQSLNLAKLTENQAPHTFIKVNKFQCKIIPHSNRGYKILFPQEFWDKLNDKSYRQAFLTEFRNKHDNRQAR